MRLQSFMFMAKSVPKNKLTQKAQKERIRQRQTERAFSPVTKTIDSKKPCLRKLDRLCILRYLLVFSLFLTMFIGTAAADEGPLFPPIQRDIFLFFRRSFELPAIQVENDNIILSNLKLLRDLGVSEEQFRDYRCAQHQCYPVNSSSRYDDQIVLINGANDRNDDLGMLSLSLQGDSAINHLYYSPKTGNNANETDHQSIIDSAVIAVYYKDGTDVWISEKGLRFSYLIDEWRYVLEYDGDGWLTNSIVHPSENNYPDFRYRLNYSKTAYTWNAYLNDHIAYTTDSIAGWFDPSGGGGDVTKPDGLNLEKMWPFRVITPEGDILSFQESRESISYFLPPKAIAPLDYSWLSPPNISESVFQIQPVRFPGFPVCESTQDQNDFILNISGLGPEGWQVRPEALKVWQYDLETGSWNDLEDSADNLLMLRVPKGILDLEDDPYVDDDGPVCSWKTYACNGEEQGYLEITLTLSPTGGVVSSVATSLPEKGILYTVYDGGMNASIQYNNGSQRISASYERGSLKGYEVCKRTDDSFLDYSYTVYSQGESCYLSSIYYRDRKGDRDPIDIVWDEGKWKLSSEMKVTDQEIEELIELCPALPIH